MVSNSRSIDPPDALLDRLPRAIARPIGCLTVLLYFHGKVIGVSSAIAFVVGALSSVLWDDLPRDEAIPSIALLVGLAVFAAWQWREASRLREELRSLEEELREEDMGYEYPNGSPAVRG